jgi:hypothetical protein
MAYHSGRVLIEELDEGAAAPAEVITESNSDAEEGPAAGVIADSAASQSQIDDASCYQAASPPFSDAAPGAAAAAASVQALAQVPMPASAVFSDASGTPCASASDTAAAAHSSAAAAVLNRLAASISGLSQPEQAIDWGPAAQSETFPHGEGPALNRQSIIQEIAEDAPEAAPRLDAAAALAACALFGYDAALEVRLPHGCTHRLVACSVVGLIQVVALRQIVM